MKPLGKFLGAIGLLALPMLGQAAGAEQYEHAGHGTTDVLTPSASGQSAFAAISEIVEILRADPDTNWSKVSIDALRRHLQDMNELTLFADVETSIQSGEVVFLVTGRDRTCEAISRMVPAHTRELNAIPNLSATAKKAENGFMLGIRSDDTDLLAQISAIGFLGTMTLGAHHPVHHLAIARGELHDH